MKVNASPGSGRSAARAIDIRSAAARERRDDRPPHLRRDHSDGFVSASGGNRETRFDEVHPRERPLPGELASSIRMEKPGACSPSRRVIEDGEPIGRHSLL
jgi:hypothetical protein